MADNAVGAADEISRLSLGGHGPEPPLPPPTLRSAGIIATDITDKFTAAVATLEPGELVKDGLFTLFDSVAALEIMDPKMDSGCVQPGEEFEVLYDVSRSLLPEEVLGIMDQLLCHEMAWHLGYPLSQTIFTSVYVEALLMPEPGSIRQAEFVRNRSQEVKQEPLLDILRAYCLGMLKACGHVNERIKSEHFYEEEDFVPNTYNRTLLTDFPTQDVKDALEAARGTVESLKGSIPDRIAEALISRLDLRDIFLDTAESPQHVRDLVKARLPWEAAIAILPRISSTHSLTKPVEDAFSTKLQRKLASTMPPRPIVQLKFDDAFNNLSRLCKDGLEVIGVLKYTDSQCLQTFVYTFQSKKPQPMVYVRTLLQTFLFNAMEILGSMSIRQLLDDDFSIITLPANPLLDRDNDEIEAVHDPRFVMSQQMELFRQRAAQPFLDILRTACQNRCRVRRTLCHLIRDWENLQADAEDIDQILQIKTKEQPLLQRSALGLNPIETYSLPLSSWTYLYKLQQMEAIVQLGFELEVYQTDELAGMYWYLNYLAKSRLQHTERIKTFVVRQTTTARFSPTIDPGQEAQLQRSLAFTRLSLLQAAVTWEFSDALSCIYTVLNRHAIIKPPPRPYSNDQLRYDLRMRPFASVSLPTPPSFGEFTLGTTQPDSSTEELLEYAERAATSAKRGFETLSRFSAEDSFSVGSHEAWTASAKGALKACIAAGVAISCLQKALQRTAGGRGTERGLRVAATVPTPDKAYHEWWIVPTVVPTVTVEMGN
ncbi:Mak10 subunit, NatC N(alpha)-terminal acetyltransferase [Metarhizium album ARSEF 1941]|uniref:Mak10 subunit, NatC N(Alpha)-terminal acetyltransferase n=1 Tax=Metarhizium album (strain ARSEF 1941) TaxID=1081103 RepID=A0A0B2X6F1_METAS|nr:Mak10 subunit, NatC N(alpha)-terminal acetyltransferase [Metarhizium album ARSEF 1941]KHO01969.1 Mak10 subunit, NatC N(alpha)-terminal acetyltransferase [Metarhizium album ARSEF 1941]